jgi:hypothetical protein
MNDGGRPGIHLLNHPQPPVPMHPPPIGGPKVGMPPPPVQNFVGPNVMAPPPMT